MIRKNCTLTYPPGGCNKYKKKIKKVLKVDAHHTFIIFYINRDRVKRHKFKVHLWTIGEKTFDRKSQTLAK